MKASPRRFNRLSLSQLEAPHARHQEIPRQDLPASATAQSGHRVARSIRGTSDHDVRSKSTPHGGKPEKIMRKYVYRAAVVAGFLGSVAAASADLNLTPQQKQTIMHSVQTETGQPAPAGFQPKVGASVPQSVSMHQLPSSVTTEVPAAKGLEYVKLDNNQVLLIDPKDRRVADIITPSGTTGAAPSPMSPMPSAPR
jgi:hypothetical protein